MCAIDAYLTMDMFTSIHAFGLHFIAPLHKYSPHRHFFQWFIYVAIVLRYIYLSHEKIGTITVQASTHELDTELMML